MTAMSQLFSKCPSCSESDVLVTKLECHSCETKFEGAFSISSLAKMEKDDQEFILDFVKCSGSLKEMGKIQSLSYPTLRNKLNTLISKIDEMQNKASEAKQAILKQLEAGAITAKEAAKQLKDL